VKSHILGGVANAPDNGRETVIYVSNIYKYYIAYKLVAEEMEDRRKAREEEKKQSDTGK